MNKKKIGKKKRIRARALDPYKRVNVCLPIDSYKLLSDIGKRNGAQVGSVARHILTFACDYEKASEEKRKTMLSTIGFALPLHVSRADALPVQGRKQGKKDSKPPKMADLVE